MTLHITIQVAADDRGDAIRLIRDAAQRVKQGRNEGEWQYCMGAFRISVTDDDIDRERSRLPDNDEYARTSTCPTTNTTAGEVSTLRSR